MCLGERGGVSPPVRSYSICVRNAQLSAPGTFDPTSRLTRAARQEMSEGKILKTCSAAVKGPELLAPAGDDEALRAAVANGADAVYFGLSDFNARHRATNFTIEELPATMQYLHEQGVRGYVTFNTLVFSDELPRAVEFLSAIICAGADAVIVQDLGTVRLIKWLAPEFPVHGSTQMTLTEPRGIEFVRRLGVERGILTRGLSTKVIGRLSAASPLPLS